MKALLIYLNGRPTTLLEARGLSKHGTLVRARKGEEPHRIPIDEADPKGRKRAQGKAICLIRHMLCLRRKLLRIEEASWVREIPNVRRAITGARARHAGSRQWRIRINEFPASIEATTTNATNERPTNEL